MNENIGTVPAKKETAKRLTPAEKRHKEFKEKSKDIKAEGGPYICTKQCTFGIAMYRRGSILNTTKGQMIPWHFRKAKASETEEEE